jgi:hypothetical protein
MLLTFLLKPEKPITARKQGFTRTAKDLDAPFRFNTRRIKTLLHGFLAHPRALAVQAFVSIYQLKI